MIKLYKGDYLERLSSIEDNSIDAIITDIPYNISKENNFTTMEGRTGIDFGEWDKGFDERDLVNLVPKLKSGGSLFVFHAFEQYNILIDIFKDLEMKDRVVWQKTNPMPRNRDRRYIVNIELATWYVKPGKPWTFNRQNDTYDPSVLTYPLTSNSGRFHPTQKNLEMMENIIKRHTNKGDIILDPFIGSGTTGIACINLDRNFIGIERDENYFDKTVKRFRDSISMFRQNELEVIK